MGGENSKNTLPLLEGDAVEVTDSYVLQKGTMANGLSCSIFSGSTSLPLVTLAKNLKIYRHPSIVKYVLSLQQKDYMYLVTEDVQPLSLASSELNALQICVGLDSIISALLFLHSNGQASHNNVCSASIYVTKSGIWKLAGLEFMLKFSETNSISLADLRPRRYEKAIPPEETKGRIVPSAVDVFGLGVLVDELLQKYPEDELPFLADFRTFCKERALQNDPHSRCSLSDLASHHFFSHDFIQIHRFLSELPLKGQAEKHECFRKLEHQLKLLPETMVASQLLSLLLARVVVLDTVAQQHVLPILLQPRSDDGEDRCLFSEATFRRLVVPKLLQMFCVRDTSVRLLLLSYLPSFIKCFTKEDLRTQVLPELLVGVKDIDDELVAATLKALALLVEVIGGAAVVGGQRARLFSDGRPAAGRPRRIPATLPERPSPDGGEDSVAEDTEAWSDWEQHSEDEFEAANLINEIKLESTPSNELNGDKTIEIRGPKTLTDIDALDIKNPNGWRSSTDDDFFKDMEPVIVATQVVAAKAEDKFKVTDTSASSAVWDSFEDWGDNPG